MESVFNMLRPLHFVLLLSAFAFFAFVSAVESKDAAAASLQGEIEAPAANGDLEAEASGYYGYGRPAYYGGWGGYGRGYYPGYGRYYGGRGYYGGWGGRGWNGGYWG